MTEQQIITSLKTIYCLICGKEFYYDGLIQTCAYHYPQVCSKCNEKGE
jgi:NAD-dependent SIR2 family protein deacetylase